MFKGVLKSRSIRHPETYDWHGFPGGSGSSFHDRGGSSFHDSLVAAFTISGSSFHDSLVAAFTIARVDITVTTITPGRCLFQPLVSQSRFQLKA